METGFLISFLAGVASVISPCVLPLIPIVVGHSLLRKKTSEILSFVSGFFLIFMLIILFTVLFTAAINYYLFYFRVTASLLIITIGIFLIVDKNIFKFSYVPNYKSNVFGSFLMGFLTCLAWSSCYGPYLVALIVYNASSGSSVYGALNLALFTGGFSFTIFFMAFIISKANLDRLIKVSKWIRILSGFIICIAGFYMLFRLLG